LELPAHPELIPAWREVSAQLRKLVGDSTYEIWLSSLEIRSWDGQRLVLGAPPATQDWVAKRFGRVLEESIRSVIGSAVQIVFATGAAAVVSAGGEGATRRRGASTGEAPPIPPAWGLNPRYTFDQFIIGDGNRLAHAAALYVAELPGQAHNPLFLHASPGLGKTHLLHAIGNYVLAFGGGASVRYTTVEEFTNHFLTALGTRSLDRFKRAYRDVDVLLIDDVQFLASKAKTEEEFFHTFNALYETGRQLVLTCDQLPSQMVGLEDRLRERFQAGLVATIKPPDAATRVAILRKRAKLDGLNVEDPQVLELIAERITDNVRALQGALIRIVAHHSLTGRPLDLDLARHVLDEIHPVQSSSCSIDSIQNTVASHFGVTFAELISSSRTARIAWPRQLAIYLARELTGASLEAIGRAFGGRNHATVLHACKRVEERRRTDAEAAQQLAHLLESVNGGQDDRPN
jgi:chromosomal replication initiator protein